MSNKPLNLLSASARSSPLSRVQVVEIEKELQTYYPEVHFETTFITTIGDRDQKTSLRSLEKTDFFTKDIDQSLQKGYSRLGIHSAKDLPDPIPKGLTIAAVTRGIDNSDSLVLPGGATLESLKPGAIIATSSERREDIVRQLREDLQFTDIRGTINQRLEIMNSGMVQGIVIAEAALIRLGLTHLNRVKLPGETTPGQGQLAVVAREDDHEVIDLLSCIDSRRKTLYLGLHVPKNDLNHKYIHAPLIKIAPKKIEKIPDVGSFSYFIFTSQSTVDLFFQMISPEAMANKTVISVGKKTTQKLETLGIKVTITAKSETSEGIVEEMHGIDLSNSRIFWPHSALSRSVISDYLTGEGIKFEEWILYDTVFNENVPLTQLDTVEEIIFTSPSTVDAFLHFYKELPKNKILTPIGSVTCLYLQNQTELPINQEKTYVAQI